MRKQSSQSQFICDAADKSLHGYVVQLCKSYLFVNLSDTRIWLEYARALTQLSRFDEAEKAFDHALASNIEQQQHSIIFSERGEMNQRRGKYEEAEEWYLKAIEAKPEAVWPRVFLGVVTFRRGDLQLAKKRLREAIECGGENETDEAYANLGGVLVAQERYAEAAQCYRRAIEIDPEYEHAKLSLQDVSRILSRNRTRKRNLDNE